MYVNGSSTSTPCCRVRSPAAAHQWRAVAKDGYPLPESQALEQDASLIFDPGEIYDFQFLPTHAGEFTLWFGLPQPLPIPGRPTAAASAPPPLISVAVHVR
ncbi:MAG: hypothetical protein ACREL5_11290 [Gemmatimonadales bacterium]